MIIAFRNSCLSAREIIAIGRLTDGEGAGERKMGGGSKMAIGPNFYIARRQANVTLNIT